MELLGPLDKVGRILVVEGVDVFHDHLEILVRCLDDDASSRSMTNAGVDVAAGPVNWCRLDLACIGSAASTANLIAESNQRARPMPLLLQTDAS